jgi:hypothetical protein
LANGFEMKNGRFKNWKASLRNLGALARRALKETLGMTRIIQAGGAQNSVTLPGWPPINCGYGFRLRPFNGEHDLSLL